MLLNYSDVLWQLDQLKIGNFTPYTLDNAKAFVEKLHQQLDDYQLRISCDNKNIFFFVRFEEIGTVVSFVDDEMYQVIANVSSKRDDVMNNLMQLITDGFHDAIEISGMELPTYTMQ